MRKIILLGLLILSSVAQAQFNSFPASKPKPPFIFWNRGESTPPVTPPGAPTLTTPANGATSIVLSPTLDWTDGTDATSYLVRLWANGTSDSIVSQAPSGSSYAIPSPLTNATKYKWRVRSVNSGGQSAWTAIDSFVVLPESPTPSTPSNNATNVDVVGGLTLFWNGVNGSPTYTIQVDSVDGTNWTHLSVNATTASTSRTITTVVSFGHQYWWRVKAVTAFAGTSDWSSTFNFTTLAPPSAVTLISPPDEATDISPPIVFDWSDGAGATSYRLRVWTSGTSDTIVSQSPSVSNYTTSETFEFSTNYSWKVRSVNASGMSAWSSRFTFTTEDEPLVAPTRDVSALMSDDDTGYIWVQYNALQRLEGNRHYLYYKTFSNGGHTIDTNRVYKSRSTDDLQSVSSIEVVRTDQGLSNNYLDEGIWESFSGASDRWGIQRTLVHNPYYQYIFNYSADEGRNWALTSDTLYFGDPDVLGNSFVGEDISFLPNGDAGEYYYYFRDSTTQSISGHVPLRTIARAVVNSLGDREIGSRTVVIPADPTNYDNSFSKDYRVAFNNMVAIKDPANSYYWGVVNTIRFPDSGIENEVGSTADTVSIRLYWSADGATWIPCNDTNQFVSLPVGKKQIFGIPTFSLDGTQFIIMAIENPRRHNTTDATADKWEIWRYTLSVDELIRYVP